MPQSFIHRYAGTGAGLVNLHGFKRDIKAYLSSSRKFKSSTRLGRRWPTCKLDDHAVSRKLAWPESFLFAGASAFLLLFANLLSGYWFLYIFALTPFLYRVSRAGAFESARLGFLFGLAFLSVPSFGNLLVTPLPTVLKLSGGAALFTLFGWVLGRLRHSFGFNPIIVAVVWVVFELAAIEFGLTQGLLDNAGSSIPYFNGLTVLFGFVLISFTVILLNSLIVLAVEKAVFLTRTREEAEGARRIWVLGTVCKPLAQKFHMMPDVRGPPVP